MSFFNIVESAAKSGFISHLHTYLAPQVITVPGASDDPKVLRKLLQAFLLDEMRLGFLPLRRDEYATWAEQVDVVVDARVRGGLLVRGLQPVLERAFGAEGAKEVLAVIRNEPKLLMEVEERVTQAASAADELKAAADALHEAVVATAGIPRRFLEGGIDAGVGKDYTVTTVIDPVAEDGVAAYPVKDLGDGKFERLPPVTLRDPDQVRQERRGDIDALAITAVLMPGGRVLDVFKGEERVTTVNTTNIVSLSVTWPGSPGNTPILDLARMKPGKPWVLRASRWEPFDALVREWRGRGLEKDHGPGAPPDADLQDGAAVLPLTSISPEVPSRLLVEWPRWRHDGALAWVKDLAHVYSIYIAEPPDPGRLAGREHDTKAILLAAMQRGELGEDFKPIHEAIMALGVEEDGNAPGRVRIRNLDLLLEQACPAALLGDAVEFLQKRGVVFNEPRLPSKPEAPSLPEPGKFYTRDGVEVYVVAIANPCGGDTTKRIVYQECGSQQWFTTSTWPWESGGENVECALWKPA